MIGQINDLSLYKMSIGLVNICMGFLFVFLYFRYARASAIRRENRVSLSDVRIFFAFFALELADQITCIILHFGQKQFDFFSEEFRRPSNFDY
jgi:uncharacterized membrane protein